MVPKNLDGRERQLYKLALKMSNDVFKAIEFGRQIILRKKTETYKVDYSLMRVVLFTLNCL